MRAFRNVFSSLLLCWSSSVSTRTTVISAWKARPLQRVARAMWSKSLPNNWILGQGRRYRYRH